MIEILLLVAAIVCLILAIDGACYRWRVRRYWDAFRLYDDVHDDSWEEKKNDR